MRSREKETSKTFRCFHDDDDEDGDDNDKEDDDGDSEESSMFAVVGVPFL